MRPYYYLGGNRALTQLRDGQPFFINTDDEGVAVWIIIGGEWETFVDNILMRLLSPGATFIDVGAHLGYYTVKAGTAVGPSGRVFSFEPNPELFPFLVRNLEINGFSEAFGGSCRAFPLAMSDAEGEAVLHFPASNMGGGTIMGTGSDTKVAHVASSTLDNVIPSDVVVDVMKIDAEGAEPKILAGAGRILERSPNIVIITEVNVAMWEAQGKATWDETFEVVARPGSRIFQVRTDGRLTRYESAHHLRDAIDARFVSYCMIVPESFPAEDVFVDLID